MLRLTASPVLKGQWDHLTGKRYPYPYFVLGNVVSQVVSSSEPERENLRFKNF